MDMPFTSSWEISSALNFIPLCSVGMLINRKPMGKTVVPSNDKELQEARYKSLPATKNYPDLHVMN